MAVKININNFIKAQELRIIDSEGVNLGLMTKEAALALARAKGVDLIEINPKFFFLILIKSYTIFCSTPKINKKQKQYRCKP